MSAEHSEEGKRLADSTNEASVAAAVNISNEIKSDIKVNPGKYRMLTGDRPTGRLHLGHYFGTLHNRVQLQEAGIETFILIADYQVITDRDDIGEVQENVLNLIADYLACGIDPARGTIFAHSAIPALNQLLLPFLSLVTEGELHRNPTVKAELDATNGRPMSGLLLTYPVHQAADILSVKSNIVPVGQDQLPHLEQTRAIAKKFNKRYNFGKVKPPVFPLPQALLSEGSVVLGTDGQKMSKSRRNTIELGMSADDTAKMFKKAVTDADRNITFDPVARPEVSNLLLLASLCTGEDPHTIAARIGDGGGGGLKTAVTQAVNDYFAPIRARRAELVKDPGYLRDVLRAGNERTNEVAAATLDDVRNAMGMVY